MRAPLLTDRRADREHRSRTRAPLSSDRSRSSHGTARDRRQGAGRDDDGRGTGRARARGAGPVAQRRHLHAPTSSTGRSTRPTPMRVAAAARGAAALYNAVNPAYHRWATDWPPVAAALLTAAERTGAVLVTMSNLYGYGRPSGPMTPESPLAATDVKGRVRHPDVGRRARRARGRPGAGHRGAGGGLLRAAGAGRRTRTSAASCRHCAPGRRAWVIGDPDAPRTLGVPAGRRRHPRHPGHRRARARPRLARAERRAALAAAGARRPGRGDGRRAGRR